MRKLVSKTFRVPVSTIRKFDEIHNYYCELYDVKLSKSETLAIVMANTYRDISVKKILDRYR